MLCSEPRPVPGIPTQLENERAKAPTLVVYNLVLYSTARLFSYCGEITRLRKDCGELRQEVGRLRTGGGQEFQSLALTTLYRHIVGICWIPDRLHICCDPCSSSIIPLAVGYSGIPTQSENGRARAPPRIVYSLVLYSTAQLFSYCGEIGWIA